MCMAALLLATGCSKSGDSNTGGSNNNGGNNPGGSTGNPGPLFTAVKNIISTNCAISSCHVTPNPQGGLNFNDNNVIVANAGNIKIKAVDNAGTANQMPPPPTPALSSTDRQKIVDWVAAGGKLTN